MSIRLDRAELIYPKIFEDFQKSKQNQPMLGNDHDSMNNIDKVCTKRNYSDMTSNETLVTKNHKQVNNNKTAKKKPMKRQCKEIKEKIFNEAPSNEYVQDEIILGTVPGYCPWPARILDIVGDTIVIEFFGTGEM